MTWGTILFGTLLLLTIVLIVWSLVRPRTKDTDCPPACFGCPLAGKCAGSGKAMTLAPETTPRTNKFE